jgi:predicted amidophosphoribosyltransferase
MIQTSPSISLRCAKCRHRLSESKGRCAHCGWEIDTVLAAERAQVFSRKRRQRHNRHARKKVALIIIGLLAVTAAVLAIMHWMNVA